MVKKVEWTEIAWADLEAMADYITRDSEYYAAAFVRDVKDAARSLATFADRGRIVPEFGDPSIRELFMGKYRMIYRVSRKHVWIIALVHGARDMEKVWNRETLFLETPRPILRL